MTVAICASRSMGTCRTTLKADASSISAITAPRLVVPSTSSFRPSGGTWGPGVFVRGMHDDPTSVGIPVWERDCSARQAHAGAQSVRTAGCLTSFLTLCSSALPCILCNS